MGMNFPGFLRLILPTFFLMYAFVGRAFQPESRHRQVFGNRDYFLEIWFDTSPGVPHQSMIPYLRFHGELISTQESQKLTGFLARRFGKSTYHFKVGGHTWEGTLKGLPQSCDGFLELRDLRTGHPVAPAKLKAGFCVEL